MPTSLINLTAIAVANQVEHILCNYPFYPYQYAWMSSTLRDQLLEYVLKQIPNVYSLSEYESSVLSHLATLSVSIPLIEPDFLAEVIRMGIEKILISPADGDGKS